MCFFKLNYFWQGDDPLTRMSNPMLQVFYDDVMVFNLENAIDIGSGKKAGGDLGKTGSKLERPSGNYSEGKWNQFRLFSRLGM